MNVRDLEARFQQIDEIAKHDRTHDVFPQLNKHGHIEIIREVVVHPPLESPPSWDQPLLDSPEDHPDRHEDKKLFFSKAVLQVDLNEIKISDEYVRNKVEAGFANRGDLPGVKVMQIRATPFYEVVEEYSYTTPSYQIIAHKGFIYDRASIPRIFWVIISKDDLSNVPPLFHDLLYQNGGVLPTSQVVPYQTFQRDQADDLFFELMRKSGVIWWRCKFAHLAVREFSGFAWKTKIL